MAMVGLLRWRLTLVFAGLLSGLWPHAMARDRSPATADTVLPGAAVVDARSIIEAARMDRQRDNQGAQAPCLDAALGGPASAPAGDAPRADKLSTLVAGLKRRAELAADSDKRSQLAKCTQDRRAAFVAQRGLQHYFGLLGSNTGWLPALATAASGLDLDGVPLPADKASQTCVRSLPAAPSFPSGATISWRVFDGVLVPKLEQVPLVAGIEAAVSVIDQECYRRRFPNSPIPPSVEVLTVHQYLDRIVDNRVARVRAAGFGPYADAFSAEYLRLKNSNN